MGSIKGRLSSASNEWATPADIFRPLSREFNFVLDCAAASWNHKTENYLTKEDDALTVDWFELATLLERADTLDENAERYAGPPASKRPVTPAVWVNPPYGRQEAANGEKRGPVLLDLFVRKAYAESQKGLTVVVLCFARPDTSLWDEVIMKAAEVRFIRSRVKFVREDGTTGPAPAPSCIVVFRPPSGGRYKTAAPKFSVWHRDGCSCSSCKAKEKKCPIKKPTRSTTGAQLLTYNRQRPNYSKNAER